MFRYEAVGWVQGHRSQPLMTTDELNDALAYSSVAFVYKSEGQILDLDCCSFLGRQSCVDEVLLAVVESDVVLPAVALTVAERASRRTLSSKALNIHHG
jgi:hypothetical protein